MLDAVNCFGYAILCLRRQHEPHVQRVFAAIVVGDLRQGIDQRRHCGSTETTSSSSFAGRLRHRMNAGGIPRQNGWTQRR